MGRKGNHPGPNKVKKLVTNVWTEDKIKAAIHKLQSVPGTLIRGVAKEFGVSECTLCFQLKKANKGEELKKAGRKCIFSKEVESELAKCIGIVCNYGFSPSLYEIQVNTLHLYWFTFLRVHIAKYIYQHMASSMRGKGSSVTF